MRTVTTQLPDELARSLDHLSESEGRTRSWLVRSALTDYIARKQEIEQLTLEGIEAARRGELISHEEILPELDEWGS
jgi:predicted transcriptional regulator